MRTKIEPLLAAFIIILLIFNAACKRHNMGWKGTVEEIDGSIVVSNPKEPIYNEEILFFEEDLSIGEKADEQEEYLFSRIMGLGVIVNFFYISNRVKLSYH